MNIFLNDFMKFHRELMHRKLDAFRNVFIRTIDAVYSSIGKERFARVARSPSKSMKAKEPKAEPQQQATDEVQALRKEVARLKALLTALREQLFKKYMIPLRAPVGIYLVAWFDTDKWDPEDSRRNQVPKKTFDEAKTQLALQAASLPKGFVVCPVVFECHIPTNI